MPNRKIRYLLPVLLLFPGKVLWALHQIPDSAIQAYRHQRYFTYQNGQAHSSLWSRFWLWINYILGQILSTVADKKNRGWVWTIVILILLLLVLLLYRYFTGKGRKGPFQRESLGIENPEGYIQDIRQTDIAKDILTAEQQANYRLATRFSYLNILKKMAEKDIIRWEARKTNRIYLEEIGQQAWKADFERATRFFEWVWYGEHALSQEEYNAAKPLFSQLLQSIKG